ncbi:protein BatD [Luteolibacter pohnpeiensis]|uniref:Protein BatD n=1 Tax=Luteolibacter pohnpeiensis TaxID=454153 RepID=A0A934S8N9_9BACT|nr:BatD family protein [Luteolibacter pohnpeiensis]MBK1884192.1 protein BatD [Luteolibacter pohnpeiensis]
MKKIISIIWLLFAVALHATQVSASLSKNTVPAGQGVLLTLNVEGGAPESQPAIPQVENLIVNPHGTSQQMQIINGDVTRSITYTYVVGSNQTGDYEIPAITVRVAGRDYTTQPLSLKVGPNADKAPEGMADDQAPEEPGKYGHLSFQMMESDRKYVYPGEIAPVKIRAYFPANTQVTLSSAPHPEGSAFTLHHLTKEPDQSSEIVNGRRYMVVTWFGGLSATKAGKYPASFVITGTVTMRDESAAGSGGRDPFFGGFFAPMVQKDIELTTKEAPLLEVKELPLEGRPDDFTGAIGQFEMKSFQIPNSLHTGEPFQVEAVVKGSGNFALLSAPHPFPVDDWKTYEGTEDFVPEDVASFGGSKSFHYNAVPLKPGEPEVGLRFSYFDPEKGEYRIVKSDTRKIAISGKKVQTPEVAATPQQEPPKPKTPQIAPLATELGAVQSYHPLSDSIWFTPVLGSCGFLSLAIIGFGIWKERGSDPVKEAARANLAATQEAREKAALAAANGDAVAFFAAAKMAVRLCIAQRDGLRPEAITLADLGEHEDETITEILVEADRVDFSAEKVSVENLKAWNEKLGTCLERLAGTRKELAV